MMCSMKESVFTGVTALKDYCFFICPIHFYLVWKIDFIRNQKLLEWKVNERFIKRMLSGSERLIIIGTTRRVYYYYFSNVTNYYWNEKIIGIKKQKSYNFGKKTIILLVEEIIK